MQYHQVIWAVFSVVLIMMVFLILAFVGIYVYLTERKLAFFIGALGMGVYVIRCLLMLLYSIRGIENLAFILENGLFLLGSVIILWATYRVDNRKMPVLWLVAWTVVLSGFIGIAQTKGIIPIYPLAIVYTFQGILYIYVGINIFKSKELYGIGKIIMTWVSAIWGVYLLGFPYASMKTWIMPVHFFLSILLTIIFLFGIFIFLMEKKRDDFVISEKCSRQLIESLPYGVIVLKPDGEVRFVNTGGICLLGAETLNQVIGKNVSDLLHNSPNELVQEYMEKLKKCTKGGFLSEVTLMGLSGKEIELEITTIPFIYEKEKSILVIARDIKVEKQAGELQRKVEENTMKLNETLEIDKLKTDFFANLSHELRTPLNIIFSTLQLFDLNIRNNNVDLSGKKVRKYMRVMKQNCYRLLRLVNNLIDSTKIDAGFFEMQLQNCNIISIVEDITLSAAEYIKIKGIDLMFDTDTEEKYVECDPDKIERIVLNLLSNAVKFTAPGGIIAVTIHDIGESVMVTIKDTGIGIPNDKLNIIFDRFRQVNKSLTRGIQGSGIGLSLVKSLVEMHNGTIDVHSEYGSGSEFRIILPAKNRSFEDCNTAERNSKESNINDGHIERINIEFSDIYFVD